MRPSAMPERKVKPCGECISPIAAACGAAVRGWAGVGGAAFGDGARCACATAPGAASGACECCAQAQLASAARNVTTSNDFSAGMALDPSGASADSLLESAAGSYGL